MPQAVAAADHVDIQAEHCGCSSALMFIAMVCSVKCHLAATAAVRLHLAVVASLQCVLYSLLHQGGAVHSGSVLQEILKAAADEKGEWYLPLDKEQVGAQQAEGAWLGKGRGACCLQGGNAVLLPT